MPPECDHKLVTPNNVMYFKQRLEQWLGSGNTILHKPFLSSEEKLQTLVLTLPPYKNQIFDAQKKRGSRGGAQKRAQPGKQCDGKQDRKSNHARRMEEDNSSSDSLLVRLHQHCLQSCPYIHRQFPNFWPFWAQVVFGRLNQFFFVILATNVSEFHFYLYTQSREFLFVYLLPM